MPPAAGRKRRRREIKRIKVFARSSIDKSAACDGIHAGRLIDTCRCDIALIRTCCGIEVFHEACGSVSREETSTQSQSGEKFCEFTGHG